VEAGVPPTFRELSEYESRQLRNEVLDQKVEEVLRDSSSPFHSLLWSLFLRYRRTETERLLQSLIASSEQFAEWYAVFRQSVEELIEQRDRALRRQVQRLFREYQRVMAKIFQSTVPAEKGVDRVRALQDWIEQQARNGIWQESVAAVEAFLHDWLDAHQQVFRKNGDLRSNIFVQPPRSDREAPVQSGICGFRSRAFCLFATVDALFTGGFSRGNRAEKVAGMAGF